jgi:hypothetical protein
MTTWINTNLQAIGLILDIIGVIFLAIGALDRTPPTWGDLANKSPKAINTRRLAWIGVTLAVLGFILQFIAIIR